MFVCYINFSCKEKIFFFWVLHTIMNFLVSSHLVCVHATVLCWGVRSGVHNTRLLAASADARQVRKYFSSTKGRVRDAACSHCNILVLYCT